MEPNTLAVLQGGVVGGRSATYEERDAFGTLGGRARMDAAALLAQKYPHAIVLATDAVNAQELKDLGVAAGRVILAEPDKQSTAAGLQAIAAHAQGLVAVVSNEYHMPRVRAMWDVLPDPKPQAEFVAAEAVLSEHDPSFAQKFEEIKQTPAYRERLESEVRGLEALKSGTYREAPQEDKRERAV